MVISAEPILAPYQVAPTEGARPLEHDSTRTALGLKLNFRFDSKKPEVTDAGGMTVSLNAKTDTQNIRGTSYSGGLQGTHNWNEAVRTAQPDRLETGVDKKENPLLNRDFIHAERPQEGKWQDLKDGEVLLMPGTIKGMVRVITNEPGKILAKRTKDGGLRVYRRKMAAENIASITTLSEYDLHWLQSWSSNTEPTNIIDEPNGPTEYFVAPTELNPTQIVSSQEPINLAEGNLENKPIEITPENKNQKSTVAVSELKPEEAVSAPVKPDYLPEEDVLDRLAEVGAIDVATVIPHETARMTEIWERINTLSRSVQKTMDRATVKFLEIQGRWNKVDPTTQKIIRIVGVGSIPLITLMFLDPSQIIHHLVPNLSPHDLGHASASVGIPIDSPPAPDVGVIIPHVDPNTPITIPDDLTPIHHTPPPTEPTPPQPSPVEHIPPESPHVDSSTPVIPAEPREYEIIGKIPDPNDKNTPARLIPDP